MGITEKRPIPNQGPAPMRHLRFSQTGLLFAGLILFLHGAEASGETMLVKTSKGYRLSILPAMGAEKVERKPQEAKGKVRIEALKETVYGKAEAPQK